MPTKEGAAAPSSHGSVKLQRQEDGAYLLGVVRQDQTAVLPLQLGASATVRAFVPMSVVPITVIEPVDSMRAELIQRAVLMVATSAEMPVQPLLSWQTSVTAVRAPEAPNMSSETRERIVYS